MGCTPCTFSCCVVQVTDERLDAYHQSFRGSEEERQELLELYQRMDGDMKKVMEWLPCSDVKLDSHRFLDAISAAIKAGEVKQTAAYRAWCKKTAQTPRPKEPLKPKKRTNKADAESSDALIAAIQKRVCLDTRTVHCQLKFYQRHVSCL
jgi:DnaJ homolog subfamily C member 9